VGFLDNANEYELRISRDWRHSRSLRLKAVLQAIKNYVAVRNENNLAAIETAVEKWRNQDRKEYADRGQPLEEQLEDEIREKGKEYWGSGTIRLVDRASHPKYEPHIWNVALIKNSTNCYAYACDDPYGHPFQDKPQPGGFAGFAINRVEDSQVRLAVMMDDQRRHAMRLQRLIPLIRLRDDPVPEHVVNVPGYYLIALVVAQAGACRDYHWLRQDDNGMWSHKPGHGDATNLDAGKHPIADPRTCDLTYKLGAGFWLDYEFVTFYYAPSGGVITGPLGE
jgi:hypothetical protein